MEREERRKRGRRGREGEGKGKRGRGGKGERKMAVRDYSKSTRLIYTILGLPRYIVCRYVMT